MPKATKGQFITILIIALIAIKGGVSIIIEVGELFLSCIWSLLSVINNILLLNDQSVLGIAYGNLISGIIVGTILSQLNIKGLSAGILRKILLIVTSAIVVEILNKLSTLIFR